MHARPGEMLLSLLKREGIDISTLCAMPELAPSGSCRLCVVEVEGARNLVPSCAFPVTAGMKVQTHSTRAVNARRTLVELLLANHPDDCLYCGRNGNCRLQDLSRDLGVRDRRFGAGHREEKLDGSSPAILRDSARCVLCGRCVRVCHEIQTVGAIDLVGRGSRTRVAPLMDGGLNTSTCVHCGQCVVVCPTGALVERSHLDQVRDALSDPGRIVVVQHAPSIAVTFGELMGARPGTDLWGTLNTALRRVGFDHVFDTSFSADLTVMEEASELVARVKGGGVLPMLTSCSPGWVLFVEQFFPEFIPNLSTCKSPQQMMGALVKSWWASQRGIDPKRIFSVAVMPCTAKKYESGRPEMGRGGLADVDAVLTTRELAELFKMHGLDLNHLEEEPADDPFGERSSAGRMFASTGGVMEAAARTAAFLLDGQELDLRLAAVRGLDSRKEAHVRLGGLDVGVAVVSGLGAARKLMEELRAGRKDLHFIEVMTCPGGCIAGGGQPIPLDTAALRARQQSLYRIDREASLRVAHRNPQIERLYREFLIEPLGPLSHELLHTHYTDRGQA